MGADKSLDMSFDDLDGGPEVRIMSTALAEARRKKKNSTTCGFVNCRPRRCWRLANAKTLLVALSCFAFLQGLIFHGFIKVFITSLERRFQLSSSQSGFIAASYDIASFPVALPLSFLGGFGNKPVYLGVAAASLGLGSFIFSLPHFLTGPYEFGEQVGTDLCVMSNYSEDIGKVGLVAPNSTSMTLLGCDPNLLSDGVESSAQNLAIFMWVFIFAQFFHGCGGSILYTVGMAFLDENVSTEDSPVYLAIFLAFSTLGPVVGYFASGQLLQYYVDIDTIDVTDLSITPEDPRWVGAWWMGFLLTGGLSLLLAFPLAAFPRQLPGHKAIQAQRVQEAHTSNEKEVESIKSIRDLPRATMYLLKNPVFDFVVLAHAMNIGVAAGVSTFVPKFVQFQFNKTASEAAFIVGTVAVPGAVGGQLLGASIVKKLKLKIPGVLKLSIVFTLISCAATAFFFFSCPQNDLAGISLPYSEDSSSSFEPGVGSICNTGCGCSSSQFDPVCGSDGVDYFSPCYAGCRTAPTNASDIYSDCSCILSASQNDSLISSHPGPDASSGRASPGHCSGGACVALYGTLALTFIFLVFHFSNEPTTEYMVMRCIPESQRTYGLGIEFAIIRIFGGIPAPILFGMVIDSTCQIWQEGDTKCGQAESVGSCWYYDVATLGTRLFLVTLIPKLISALFFAAALVVYKPSPADDLEKNEKEIEAPTTETKPEEEEKRKEKEVGGEESGENEPMIWKEEGQTMEAIEEGEEENSEEEKGKK